MTDVWLDPGQLPTWLRGNLYRNGAAVKEIGPDKFKHLFDGLACVHKFHVDGATGQVTYQVSSTGEVETVEILEENVKQKRSPAEE